MNLHPIGVGAGHRVFTPRGEPIIRSLLENDVYKFMMMNFIHRYYSNLQVTFEFKNRTKDVDLLLYIDPVELQEQFDMVAALTFTDADIAHLRSWSLYPEHYLRALKNLKLTAPVVNVQDGQLTITAAGRWFEETLWEIYVLVIVSELYVRGRAFTLGRSEEELRVEGDLRLDKKIALYKEYPGLRASQFGLRRRAGGPWEEHVTKRLMGECPGLITGVSNVYLAKKLGVEAQGTNAHEMPMAVYALMRHHSNIEARNSVYKVLHEWQQLYGLKALIMLPDTFGTDAFLEQLPHEFAIDWRGFRHDSGDPIAFGEKVIAFYERHGIDPRDKLIIFSDGLTPEKKVELFLYFQGRINVVFGVGTNWTNDLGFVIALSLVMKVTSAAGNPAVKLSDNLNKATGDAAEVEVAKRLFGYTNTTRESLVY